MAADFHPKMPVSERAKQFAPFAALRGLGDALRAKEKLTVEKAVVSEDAAEELNRTLCALKKGDMVTVTWFCAGEYLRRTGAVTQLDPIGRRLLVVDTSVPFDDILALDTEE